MAAVYHGFTTREISEAWHLPVGTVKTRLRRPRQAARELSLEVAVNRLDCAQLIDLPGIPRPARSAEEARATAIAHLATCTSCQQEVTSLTTVTDRLLLLAPRRAVRRVRAMRARSHPDHVRSPPPSAASGLGDALRRRGRFVLALSRSAAPRQRSVRAAGVRRRHDAHVRRRHRRAGHRRHRRPGIAVPDAPRLGRAGGALRRFRCRLRRAHRDGRRPRHDAPDHTDRRGVVGRDARLDRATVRSVAVVDGNGYVWCEAELATS